jgi:hypothetical protein
MIFGMATLEEPVTIKNTMDMYAKAEGQRINDRKTGIFFFNVMKVVQKRIANRLGWSIGKLPSKYLGVSVFTGASRTAL